MAIAGLGPRPRAQPPLALRGFHEHLDGAAMKADCTNASKVERAVRSLLSRPRRSSSLVEAFNSALRVLQMKHRNVSDDLLSVHALA